MSHLKIDNSRKIVLGVCSGISRKTKIHRNVLRLLFFLLTIMGGGFGLLIYVVLWMAMFSVDCERPKVLGVLSYIAIRNKIDISYLRIFFSFLTLITGIIPGMVLYLLSGILVKYKLLKLY